MPDLPLIERMSPLPPDLPEQMQDLHELVYPFARAVAHIILWCAEYQRIGQQAYRGLLDPAHRLPPQQQRLAYEWAYALIDESLHDAWKAGVPDIHVDLVESSFDSALATGAVIDDSLRTRALEQIELLRMSSVDQTSYQHEDIRTAITSLLATKGPQQKPYADYLRDSLVPFAKKNMNVKQIQALMDSIRLIALTLWTYRLCGPEQRVLACMEQARDQFKETVGTQDPLYQEVSQFCHEIKVNLTHAAPSHLTEYDWEALVSGIKTMLSLENASLQDWPELLKKMEAAKWQARDEATRSLYSYLAFLDPDNGELSAIEQQIARNNHAIMACVFDELDAQLIKMPEIKAPELTFAGLHYHFLEVWEKAFSCVRRQQDFPNLAELMSLSSQQKEDHKTRYKHIYRLMRRYMWMQALGIDLHLHEPAHTFEYSARSGLSVGLFSDPGSRRLDEPRGEGHQHEVPVAPRVFGPSDTEQVVKASWRMQQAIKPLESEQDLMVEAARVAEQLVCLSHDTEQITADSGLDRPFHQMIIQAVNDGDPESERCLWREHLKQMPHIKSADEPGAEIRIGPYLVDKKMVGEDSVWADRIIVLPDLSFNRQGFDVRDQNVGIAVTLWLTTDEKAYERLAKRRQDHKLSSTLWLGAGRVAQVRSLLDMEEDTHPQQLEAIKFLDLQQELGKGCAHPHPHLVPYHADQPVIMPAPSIEAPNVEGAFIDALASGCCAECRRTQLGLYWRQQVDPDLHVAQVSNFAAWKPEDERSLRCALRLMAGAAEPWHERTTARDMTTRQDNLAIFNAAADRRIDQQALIHDASERAFMGAVSIEPDEAGWQYEEFTL